jgi:hypothetical protein
MENSDERKRDAMDGAEEEPELKVSLAASFPSPTEKENSSTSMEPCRKERGTNWCRQDTGMQDASSVMTMVENGADEFLGENFFEMEEFSLTTTEKPSAEFELKLRIYSSQNDQKPVLTSVWVSPNTTLSDIRKDVIAMQLVNFELPPEYMFQYYDHEEDLYSIVSPQNEKRYKAKDLATLKLGILPVSLPNNIGEQQENQGPHKARLDELTETVVKQEPESDDDVKQELESEDESQRAKGKGRKRTRKQEWPHRAKKCQHSKPWRQKMLQTRHDWEARSKRAHTQKQPYLQRVTWPTGLSGRWLAQPYLQRVSWPTGIDGRWLAPSPYTTKEWWFEIRGDTPSTNVSCKAREWRFEIF